MKLIIHDLNTHFKLFVFPFMQDTQRCLRDVLLSLLSFAFPPSKPHFKPCLGAQSHYRAKSHSASAMMQSTWCLNDSFFLRHSHETDVSVVYEEQAAIFHKARLPKHLDFFFFVLLRKHILIYDVRRAGAWVERASHSFVGMWTPSQ